MIICRAVHTGHSPSTYDLDFDHNNAFRLYITYQSLSKIFSTID